MTCSFWMRRSTLPIACAALMTGCPSDEDGDTEGDSDAGTVGATSTTDGGTTAGTVGTTSSGATSNTGDATSASTTAGTTTKDGTACTSGTNAKCVDAWAAPPRIEGSS